MADDDQVMRGDGSFDAEAMRRHMLAQAGPVPPAYHERDEGCMSLQQVNEVTSALGVLHAMGTFLALTLGRATCDPAAVRLLMSDVRDVIEATENLEAVVERNAALPLREAKLMRR